MSYGPYQSPRLVQSRAASLSPVFSRTMGLVAVTAAFFAAGAWIGRGLPVLFGLGAYVIAFILLLVMQFARRASAGFATFCLFGFGTLMGVASAPTLAYYAGSDPMLLAEAGGATALFMIGLGAAGYGTRRDLSMLARVSGWALFGLILLGVLMIFIHIPGAGMLYAILGLVVFAGLVVVDFQRLRRTQDVASAPYLAVSIFLDALNVFWFFLRLFGDRR